MKKYNTFFIVFCSFIFFALSSNSYAFIPDAQNLVNFMQSKKGSCSLAYKVPDSKIFYFDHEKPVEMNINLYYLCSGGFRADIFFDSSDMTYMESLSKAAMVQSNELISEKISGYYLFKDILLFNGYEELLSVLSNRGCDISSVRLDRKDDKIFYVIGAMTSDVTTPQTELWIDKESFLPYYYQVSIDGNLFSFKYKDWFKSYSLRYPGSIEIFYNGNFARKIESGYIETSFDSYPKDFFDVEGFVRKHKKTETEFNSDFKNTTDSIEKIFQ